MTTTIYRPVPGYEDLYAGLDSTIVHATKGLLEQKMHKGKGYLYVTIPGHASVHVHRIMAATFLGVRPLGMVTRHGESGKMVNAPGNLCYGTQSDNVQDSLASGTQFCASKAKCPQGHDYSVENTYTAPNGWRQCRICRRDHDRKRQPGRRRKTSPSPMEPLAWPARASMTPSLATTAPFQDRPAGRRMRLPPP